jgi:hypothetical protein
LSDAAATKRPASVVRVLATALALLALGALVVVLATRTTGRVDAGELSWVWTEPGELPLGMRSA